MPSYKKSIIKNGGSAIALCRKAVLYGKIKTIRLPYYMKNTHAQHGFTLVEISIVLVIIGLIVGGILVGRDLIHAAVIRADITAVQKMDTAVLTFKLKYNALPGDTQEATTFLGSAAYNGDGNGII